MRLPEVRQHASGSAHGWGMPAADLRALLRSEIDAERVRVRVRRALEERTALVAAMVDAEPSLRPNSEALRAARVTMAGKYGGDRSTDHSTRAAEEWEGVLRGGGSGYGGVGACSPAASPSTMLRTLRPPGRADFGLKGSAGDRPRHLAADSGRPEAPEVVGGRPSMTEEERVALALTAVARVAEAELRAGLLPAEAREAVAHWLPEAAPTAPQLKASQRDSRSDSSASGLEAGGGGCGLWETSLNRGFAESRTDRGNAAARSAVPTPVDGRIVELWDNTGGVVRDQASRMQGSRAKRRTSLANARRTIAGARKGHFRMPRGSVTKPAQRGRRDSSVRAGAGQEGAAGQEESTSLGLAGKYDWWRDRTVARVTEAEAQVIIRRHEAEEVAAAATAQRQREAAAAAAALSGSAAAMRRAAGRPAEAPRDQEVLTWAKSLTFSGPVAGAVDMRHAASWNRGWDVPVDALALPETVVLKAKAMMDAGRQHRS